MYPDYITNLKQIGRQLHISSRRIDQGGLIRPQCA